MSGTYPTKLHFYSYKAGSQTELAIDKTIPVTVHVVISGPHESIDNTNFGVSPTKIIRDGRLLFIRGEQMYDILGTKIR